ncbi:GbsR/MarR family transcriptional regulator [Natrarchaeobius sp. A-rgal3]|uniref:GbsR/MarR family transcriptional regulator n=1 Tax=Natrarchaeobius versutus TaxID=1679078 RepID=UPI00350EEBBD
MTSDEFEQARDAIVDAMAQAAEVYGINQSYGRLYGILYLSPEPCSLDDLVEESGYAKSTVSSAMKALERYYLVSRHSKPGEGKRVYFTAETDFWTVFEEIGAQEGRRELRIMTRGIDSAERALEEAPETERTEHARERLDELTTLFERIDTLLTFVSDHSLDELVELIELAQTIDDDRS